MSYRVRTDCRLCGSTVLNRVLELPPTPPANELPRSPNVDQERFPLWLASCGECLHVQLPVVVDPERLFRDYVYVSGTSPVFVEHFRRYAEACSSRLSPGDFVVEIGSNDGTLLRFFKERGMRVIGVDPATEIAAQATDEGIATWATFFDEKVASELGERHGKAKLVVANNVFAHADDLASIARGIRSLLAPDGRFVFEVSYLPDVLDGTLFDTIYHEHLSYHSVEPLVRFFDRLCMTVVDVERVNTHGGSIRVSVAPTTSAEATPAVARMIAEERRLGLGRSTPVLFANLARSIGERKQELLRLLRGAKMGGKTVAGYGAPAKATTLLHAFDLVHGSFFDFVVDDSPHKHGRYLPGTDIPVVPSTEIAQRGPDYVVILAWNFAESILNKLSAYRAAGGKCVVPLPKVRVID